MRRKLSEEERNFKNSTKRKYWEEYLKDRDAKKIEARNRIALAILQYEKQLAEK